jgi:prepilin-type N-terminal cleavage/methylation domain-containing protein
MSPAKSSRRTAAARQELHVEPRESCGFTLVEVVIALLVSAVVVLSARTLIEILSTQTLRASATTRDMDADANGERLLRAVVGQLEVPSPADSTFGGDEQQAHFGSWCATPRGWLERCRVELRVYQGPDGAAVIAQLSTRETILVKRGRTADGLRYLADPADGGKWLVRWPNSLSVPLALALLIDGDTLIVRVGDRA